MRFLWSLILLLLLAGCGGGGGGSAPTGNSGTQNSASNNAAPSSQTANLTLRFNLLARAVPAYVTDLRISGLSSMGDVLYGPVSFPKNTQISVPGVPTSCTQIRIEYLNGTVVRGLTTVPVSLQAGQTVEINDPTFQDVDAVLRTLTIEAPLQTVPAGATLQLAARGGYNDSTQQTLTSSVSWSSSSTSVADVSTSGLVSTHVAGNTTITARLGQVQTQFDLSVSQAQMSRLRINPTSLSIPKGSGQNLSAIAVYTDGSEVPVGGSARWTSDNENISSAGIGGLVRGVDFGQTNIRASYGAFSDSIVVTVTEGILLYVELGAPQVVAPGTIFSLPLTAVYSDGPSRTASNTRYVSSNDFVASVLNDGTVTAKNPGDTTVTATDLDSGLSDEVVIHVTGSPLVSMTLSPPKPWVEKGNGILLTVTGLYQDGTTRDLTHSVVYSVDNAHIDAPNDRDTRGIVWGRSPGIGRLTATYPGSGISASSTVRVMFYRKKDNVTVASQVNDMERSRSGSELYFLTSRGIETLDPVDLTVELKVAGTGNDLELSPDGHTLLVSDTTNVVRAIDTRDWSSRSINLGSNTRGTAFSSGQQVVALCSDSLKTFDLASGTVLNTVEDVNRLHSFAGAIRIDRASQQLYLAVLGISPSDLLRYSLTSGTPAHAQTVRGGASGQSLKVNPGRGLVFPCGGGNSIPNQPPYQVAYYGLNPLNVLRIFDIGAYPTDAAFSTDGEVVFSLNGGDNVALYREDDASLYRRVSMNLGSSFQRPEKVEVSSDDNYVFVYSFNNYNQANIALITVIEQK